MNEFISQQHDDTTHVTRPTTILWLIACSVVGTAIIVGAVVYVWLTRASVRTQADFQQQIIDLQSQLLETEQPQTTTTTSEETDQEIMSSTVDYTNDYYNFSIALPTDLQYCLNDFCDNSVEDKNIQYVSITGFQLLKYEGREITKGVPTLIDLEINPRKNSLGMSAVDFAKRSLELNNTYNPERSSYSAASETTFAGEPAYTFIANRIFEERGLKLSYVDGELAAVNAPEFFEKIGQGRMLEAAHRVIYFDHDGVMYRIMYPIDTPVVADIIESFKFID